MMIAGGGTGGHVFPGLAVAKMFMKRNGKNEIIYVGAKSGIEASVIPKAGINLELLSVGGIKGKGLYLKLKNMMKMLGAVFAALKIIGRFKPDVVLGVGGYASYPALFAAKLKGIKTAILEQNTVAGLTNRILGKLVNRIYAAFDMTVKNFPSNKVLVTGNPLREEIIKIASNDKNDSGKFVVFVFGGSQGASKLNRATIDSLKGLEGLQGKITFIHQTGNKDQEIVREGYKKNKIESEIFEFTNDMAGNLSRSDIVVSRSGSGICEIMASGKPSILVPYPYSSYGHQDINADLMVEAGAALKISDKDLTGESLAHALLELYKNEDKRKKMSVATKKMARLDATERVVEDLFALAGGAGV